MIKHTANGKEYLFIKVPKDARDFDCWDVGRLAFFDYLCGAPWDEEYDVIDLPYPSRFLFRCSEATEEQARNVFEKPEPLFYRDYIIDHYAYFSALKSLASLCESIGWGLDETVVVEKV